MTIALDGFGNGLSQGLDKHRPVDPFELGIRFQYR